MDEADVLSLLQQAHYFNQQWKYCETEVELQPFATLMRQCKDRCQLTLLRCASTKLVWAKVDFSQSNLEWLVGGVEQDDRLACHIPFATLQSELSDDLKAVWNINKNTL